MFSKDLTQTNELRSVEAISLKGDPELWLVGKCQDPLPPSAQANIQITQKIFLR